jgi:hypothetical protein
MAAPLASAARSPALAIVLLRPFDEEPPATLQSIAIPRAEIRIPSNYGANY